MNIKESGEMYLETIYILTQKNKNVRSIDVVNYMGFSKPSVSRAISLLKNEEFIQLDGQGYIQLTEKGLSHAKSIYERHTVLTKLFIDLGVNEKTAVDDACRIEHYLSDETFNAIKNHLKKHNSSK